MPNLWSRTSQTIQELFKGPRSRDIEFDNKLEEYKTFYKGLLELKNVIINAAGYFSGIKTFGLNVSSSLIGLYSGSENELKDFIKHCTNVHDEFGNHLEKFKEKMKSLNSKIDDMLEGDKVIEEKIEKRNEARKTYDHYDEKLDEMYKESVNKATDKSFKEKIERNEIKYKEATDKYLSESLDCYKVIHSFISSREKELGPLLITLMTEERNLFYSVASSIKKLDGFEKVILGALQKKGQNDIITYDPEKYLRRGNLQYESMLTERKERSKTIDDKKVDLKSNDNNGNNINSNFNQGNNNTNFNNNQYSNNINNMNNMNNMNHMNNFNNMNRVNNMNMNNMNSMNNMNNMYNMNNNNMNNMSNFNNNMNNINNNMNNMNNLNNQFNNFQNQFSNLNMNNKSTNNLNQQISINNNNNQLNQNNSQLNSNIMKDTLNNNNFNNFNNFNNNLNTSVYSIPSQSVIINKSNVNNIGVDISNNNQSSNVNSNQFKNQFQNNNIQFMNQFQNYNQNLNNDIKPYSNYSNIGNSSSKNQSNIDGSNEIKKDN